MRSRLAPPSIEPLEARIAPAIILIGAAPDGFPPDNILDTEYVEAAPSPGQTKFFVDTSNPSLNPADIAISAAVDDPATANTFFLRLAKGDQVRAFSQANNYEPLITVTKGNVIAFFVDYDGNNNYSTGELTGLALGKNAAVNVTGELRGDVVTNLDERGTKNISDDLLDMTGLVSSKQGISKLAVTSGNIRGNVLADGTIEFGKVLSGSNIKSINIVETVGSVLAGTAADGASFDFFPDRYDPVTMTTQIQAGGSGTISVSAGVGVAGASIGGAKIGGVVDRVEAGSGGSGANGGSLKNVEITKDSNGFSLLSGSGGAGDAGGNGKGGNGGSLKKVFVAGQVDLTPNGMQPLPELINISAGDGGDAVGGNKGGKGGALSKVFVGFELNNRVVQTSVDILADRLVIAAGAGGAGGKAGNGGNVDSLRVRVLTPDVDGENEVSILAGVGGANSTDGGKAGKGGSLTDLDVRNLIRTSGSDTVLIAGDGGVTTGSSRGANGGSVKNLTTLGFDQQIIAGSGSAGGKGGNGGQIKSLTIVRDDVIVAQNVLVNAGRGGDVLSAAGGNAGKGGKIKGLTALATDIIDFSINAGTAGDGGDSLGGKGGNGGGVTGVNIVDTAVSGSVEGALNVNGGSGGDGSAGGGKGGALKNTNFSAFNANLTIVGGDGGSATSSGKGGAAGGIKTAQIVSDGSVGGVPVFGSLTAGTGGAGAGASGNGGKGGDVKRIGMNVDGDGALIAGNGGSGGGQARAGKGGSVITSGVFATAGAGILRAGDAGVDGGKAANGGRIVGNVSGLDGAVRGDISGLRAATDLTIVAGSGSHGGSGGSITGIAYGSTADALTPTPTGEIIVRAGNGSAEGSSVGKGGSLKNIFGSLSSGADTSIRAGDGGGSGARAANGGSISTLILSLGGGAGTELNVQAGDGGDTSGGNGGRGGSVKNLGTANLDPGTIFRSLAAGDGGDGVRGGNGGSISRIAVQNEDIGIRTGEVFGFTTMGGIFAGAGGSGLGGPGGKPGNVSTVNANSIAAIVAGRGDIPQAAGKLSRIFLNGDQLLLAREGALNPDGSFDPGYYSGANLVGAIVDITQPNAFVFNFIDVNGTPGFQIGDMPIDGLILAQSMDQRTINFIPEAKLVAGDFFDSENTL